MILIIIIILLFITQSIGAILDKRLSEGDVPAEGSIVVYILKNAFLSIIAYRILLTTYNFWKLEAQNRNEAIIMKTIFTMYALSIACIILLIVITPIYIYRNW